VLPGQQRSEAAGSCGLTTQASEADRWRVWEAGFDHYLTKPADPTEVETLVRHTAQMIEAAMPEPLCSVGPSH
jgi:DNA-binding response OmpR family regulator